jgi:hypothetical protein
VLGVRYSFILKIGGNKIKTIRKGELDVFKSLNLLLLGKYSLIIIEKNPLNSESI